MYKPWLLFLRSGDIASSSEAVSVFLIARGVGGVLQSFPSRLHPFAPSDLSVHIFIRCVCKHWEDRFIFWKVRSRISRRAWKTAFATLTGQLHESHTHTPHSPFCLKQKGTVFTDIRGMTNATPHYLTGTLEAWWHGVCAQAWRSCKRALSIRHVISFIPIIICVSPKHFPGKLHGASLPLDGFVLPGQSLRCSAGSEGEIASSPLGECGRTLFSRLAVPSALAGAFWCIGTCLFPPHGLDIRDSFARGS